SGVKGSGAACVSCSGIAISATGQGSVITAVSGNVVQQAGGTAIAVSSSQGGAQLQITIDKNLLREGSATSPAISVRSGAAVNDYSHVCADIGGIGASSNKIEGAWDPNGTIHVVQRMAG